jgi:iron complex outermembrane receptor protein
MQINFLLPSSPSDTRVVNAGKAEIRGLETDLTWLIAKSLSFTLNDAYLDAKMISVRDPNTGNDISSQYRFSEAPHHSYSAALDYTWSGLHWADLDLNCAYNYTSVRAGSSLTGDGDLTMLESHGILNLRAGLSDIKLLNGKWSMAAWVHNVLDDKYAISAVTQQPSSSRAVMWGEPRTYGLDVVYNYR